MARSTLALILSGATLILSGCSGAAQVATRPGHPSRAQEAAMAYAAGRHDGLHELHQVPAGQSAATFGAFICNFVPKSADPAYGSSSEWRSGCLSAFNDHKSN